MNNYEPKGNEIHALSKQDRDNLIDILTNELPVLRAKIGISQDDLSNIVGISRQTYSAIETKKRRMSWNTFLSLLLFFDVNEKTEPVLKAIGAFPDELISALNIDNREDNIKE